MSDTEDYKLEIEDGVENEIEEEIEDEIENEISIELDEYYISNDERTPNLLSYIEHFIEKNNYNKISKTIDICVLMYKYNISLEFIHINSLKYYLKNLRKSKIKKTKLTPKKQELLNYYKRNYNLKLLFYFLNEIDKIDIIEKKLIEFIEKNNIFRIKKNDNLLDKSGVDIQNNAKLSLRSNLIPIEKARNLIKIKQNVEQGYTSTITFHQIDKFTKLYIENKIKNNISNIVIKKDFSSSIFLEKNNDINDCKDIEDNDIINYLGGIDGLFEREVKCLKKLYGYNHFPYLLCVDEEKKSIYINYCGETLNESNIPKNWKEQIEDCLIILEKENIFHNDIWIPNLLVNEDTINIIDFGFGTFNSENFPFTNMNKLYLDKSNSFFEFLDKGIDEGTEKRFKFKMLLNT